MGNLIAVENFKGIVPVAWWQKVDVEVISDNVKRVWSFSPIGIGKVVGWQLMGYTESKQCSLGEWHVTQNWIFIAGHEDENAPASIPEEVWKQLDEETKDIENIEPWEGAD